MTNSKDTLKMNSTLGRALATDVITALSLVSSTNLLDCTRRAS